MTATAWASPRLQQRREYVPKGPIERWMVPLLGGAIEDGLARYAAAPHENAQCLDVGCGSQPFRPQLKALGFRYVSFDANQNQESTVDVIGAIDAPIPDQLQAGSFHFVLCTEVLEHVARWPEAFANLAALLAPGGRLLVTAPHIWIPHEEPADFFRPTSLGLEFHARAVGLRPLEVTRLGDGFDVLGTILAATRIKPAGGRWWNRPVSVLPKLLHRALLACIQTRSMARFVSVRTDLYLNTLAVFEKPEL